MADITRPWGGLNCKNCEGTCYGHYVTDLAQLLKLHAFGKAIRCCPPSEILSEFHRTLNGRCVEETDVDTLAKKCLLSPEDVQLWLKHLEQVSINRKRGAQKASITKKKKINK